MSGRQLICEGCRRLADIAEENEQLRAEIERLRVEVVALRAQHEGARDLDEWLAKHPEYAKAASTSRE